MKFAILPDVDVTGAIERQRQDLLDRARILLDVEEDLPEKETLRLLFRKAKEKDD